MKKGWYYVILFQLLLVIFVISLINTGSNGSKQIRVVAAENFWGSIASQIGGNKVQVSSIVSDPNADPHEFESSSKNARDFANANLVIINGIGYDSWANKLIDSNKSNSRQVLDLGSYFNLKSGDNPHLWYSINYTKLASQQIFRDLVKIDPNNVGYYQKNLDTLNIDLNKLDMEEKLIGLKYSNTSVSSTESIFYYMAKEMNLNLISPKDFMQAVSEGNDPPSSSVASFINQLNIKEPAFLLYNQQTESPITESMKKIASSKNIPVIGVTETMPTNNTYQQWMGNQINQIYKVLSNE
jgi:zinc/manganese transport system substrate-binding protein